MKCSIKGCNKKATLFKKKLRFCTEHAQEIGLVSGRTILSSGETMEPDEKRHNDFLMFKRTHFQVRDRALTEEAYLHFLAGYFGIIPTPEDLEIPEKDYFKIQKKEEGGN